MKHISKKTLAAAAVIATLGAGVIGIGTTFAAQTGAVHPGISGLVQAIAAKFNLNVTDVQAVFDAQKTQMEADRQAQDQTRLDQAVTDGKITQDQETLILQKQQELKDAAASLQGKTPEEIRAAMKTQMDALTQWAKDNNIPLMYLHGGPFMGFRGMGRGRGGFNGGGFGHGPSSNDAGTQTNP